ncbi:MAG: hypothetical protein GXY53_09675 [Desulfobulbus sp.]|nr:hypothetical protein [Desulfobulbus sp.]
MNNIQEMDWADDRWHGHTGMDSTSDYCRIDQDADETASGNQKVLSEQKEQVKPE